MRRFLLIIIVCLLLVACQRQGTLDLVALSEQARSGDQDAARQLVGLLGVEENGLGSKVYPIVIEIGQPLIEPLLASVQTESRFQRERVIAALGTLRANEAVQPVSKVLADKRLKRRYVSAWALGEIGDVAGIQPLLQALADHEDVVRQYATRALIKFNRDAVDPLIAFLETAQPLAAGAAIRALGDIGDKNALDVLLRQVEGPNRKDAFLALGKLRDSRAEQALVKGLEDPEWEVRMNAAMALGPLGTDRSVPLLRRTLEDEVMVVREWSARSLSIIVGKTVLYRNAAGEMVEPYSVYH